MDGTRSKKAKSMTYTGCWTCRSRKVKCDERQLRGCGVCERANLQCAGYEVNLRWPTGEKHPSGKAHSGRRRIRHDISAAPPMTENEVNEVLSSLDVASLGSKDTMIGLFGMFCSKDTSRPLPQSHQAVAKQTVRNYADQNMDGLNDLGCTYARVPLSHSAELGSKSSSPATHSQDETYPTSQDPEETFLMDEDEDPQISKLVSQYPIGVFDEGLATTDGETSVNETLDGSSWPAIISPTPYLDLSLPIFQDHDSGMLMHHYTKHVTDILQPILHPSNPWRTTYVPIALEGTSDVLVSRNSGRMSHAAIALSHSLQASAAFHLQRLNNNSERFHRLGVRHREMSVQALKEALTDASDLHRYKVYMAAMLSLVTTDIINGDTSDFGVHLNGCNQLQKSRHFSSIVSLPTQQLNSICNFLSLLARTTSHDVQAQPWPKDGRPFALPMFESSQRCIEYMYGITPKIANALQKSCQLNEYLAYYEGGAIEEDKDVPPGLLTACEELGDDLAAWTMDTETFISINPSETDMLEIARCQARAWHAAVLLYYYRTIQKCDPCDLENERRITLENMTMAEDIKDKFLGGEKRVAPLSWPAFMAALEASDREPWRRWWCRVQEYRVGNFWRQWVILQEVWEVIDKGGNGVDWRPALKQLGRLVLAI